MKKILLFAIVIIFGSVKIILGQCFFSMNPQPYVCDSSCQGVIAVSFSGGQLPMSVYLDDGTTTLGPFTATSFWQTGNLCPGNYTITVIDNVGDTCTGSGSFSIISSPSPVLNISTTNATCTGCADGTATAFVTGGTPPFAFQWSNGSTMQSIIGLTPGTYSCWVTDASGCWDSDTVQIGVGAGPGAYMIGGTVYYDQNSNGIKDPGDAGIGNVGINLMPGSVNAISNLSGDYGYAVLPGTYDLNFTGAPGWSLTSSPATYDTTVISSAITGLDFGVYPDSVYGSAVTSLTSNFPRCQWNVAYFLTVHNNGFTFLDGTLTFTHDPLLTYVSSSQPPFSQVGNTLTYTYTGLAPGQSFTISVVLTEPAGGTPVSSSLASTGTDTFGYQFAQNAVLNQVVNCSFDPNDKQVFPAGFGVNHFVTMDTWLEYMIRFQNTGTDTAFKVVILDTLDAGLNQSTFTLLGSSHPVSVNMRSGNEVSFTFDNILLPDSNVNEPGSHGYVLYRIQGNPGNPDPTVVNNTAYIYFDFNAPVQTNTVLTTLSDNFVSIPESSTQTEFELFPNPANKTIRIRSNSTLSESVSIRILDISGRIVAEKHNLSPDELFVDVSMLMPGTYTVEINTENTSPAYIRFIRN